MHGAKQRFSAAPGVSVGRGGLLWLEVCCEASEEAALLTVRVCGQARVRAISEIVAELVKGVGEGRDVNLNSLKSEVRLCSTCLCFVCVCVCVFKSGCTWRAEGRPAGCSAGGPQERPLEAAEAGGDHQCCP